MISAAQALHFGLSSPSAPVFLTSSFWNLPIISSEPKPADPMQKRNLLRYREGGPTSHSTHIFYLYFWQSSHPCTITNCLWPYSFFFHLENAFEERCTCMFNLGLEAVYLWPWTGHCVHGVTTGVLFQLHCVLTTKPPVKLNKITNFTVDFLPALLCSPHTPGLSPHTAGDGVGPNQSHGAKKGLDINQADINSH